LIPDRNNLPPFKNPILDGELSMATSFYSVELSSLSKVHEDSIKNTDKEEEKK
jgi:hypothetical protein